MNRPCLPASSPLPGPAKQTPRSRPQPQMRLSPPVRLLAISLLGLAASSSFAQGTRPSAAPASLPSTPFDQLWGLATLYQNKANPLVQEIKVRGRYQGQQYWLESNQGQTQDWENRRSRLGFDAKLLQRSVDLRLEAENNPEFASVYGIMVDAYLKWKPVESFSLTLGKQKPQIGYYDWLQSTNSQPTFERSQIFGQLKVSRATGAVAQGEIDQFSWQAGLYSTQMNREFGTLDGGLAYGAGVGYDAKEALDLDKAEWRFDWLHSDPQAEDTILNRYHHLYSSTLWLQQGRGGLVAETFLAAGGAPTACGLFIQPTYDLIPAKLQVVGRYSFAAGDGGESLILQKRYEATAPDLSGTKGSLYQSAYLGLQYFIYGDKLKLMAGAEYARLQGGPGEDFSSVTFLTGLRLSF